MGCTRILVGFSLGFYYVVVGLKQFCSNVLSGFCSFYQGVYYVVESLQNKLIKP